MIIDEVMEENEEEEDLNNIPLFASSEEMEEPPSLVESSLTLPERDSAPQAVSTSLLNSDIRPEDLREEDIREFFQNGCGCVDECHKKFSELYVQTLRSDMLQMTRSEYDQVIMAQMKATSSMGGLTSANRKRPHDREKNTFCLPA